MAASIVWLVAIDLLLWHFFAEVWWVRYIIALGYVFAASLLIVGVAANIWRFRITNKRHFIIWLVIWVVYLATRALMASQAVPHNDEAIYGDYAQQIHSDWWKNYAVSYDGRMYGDVKDPLQFWASAPFITMFDNPYFSLRFVAILFWLLGFCFSVALYRKFDKSDYWWIWFAVLYITSAYFAYFDGIAVTEVFVYSTWIAYLYFLYNLTEKYLHEWRISWSSLVWSLVFLVASVFAKLSGMLFFVFWFLITLWTIVSRTPKKNIWWKKWITLSLFYVLPVIVAFVLHAVLVRVNTNTWLWASIIYSPKELLSLPWQAWWFAIKEYWRTIIVVQFSAWGAIWLGFAVVVIWTMLFVMRRKQEKWTWLFMVLLAIVSMLLVALLVRSGWYVRHKGMFFVFVLMLIAFSLEQWRKDMRTTKGGTFLLWAVWLVFIAITSYQAFSGICTDKQTRMAVEETPTGWANGAEFWDLAADIAKLPDGIIYVDPQWWMPGTALTVYMKWIRPRMMVSSFTNDLTQQMPEVIQRAASADKGIYFVMDVGRNDRGSFNAYLVSEMCDKRRIYEKTFKGAHFMWTRLVLCTFLPWWR